MCVLCVFPYCTELSFHGETGPLIAGYNPQYKYMEYIYISLVQAGLAKVNCK